MGWVCDRPIKPITLVLAFWHQLWLPSHNCFSLKVLFIRSLESTCYVKLSKCKESYNLKKSEVSGMPQNCRWASLNEWKLVIVVYLPLLESRHEKQLLVIGQTAQLLSCWCMKHRWSGYLAMFVTSFIVILKSTRITCWLCEWSPVSRTYWHWPAYFIQSAQITNSTARVLLQQWYNTLCFLYVFWQLNSRTMYFKFLDDEMSLLSPGADF